MKLKHLLLTALCAVMSIGAWGAVITETYDFKGFTATSTPDISLSATAVEQSGTNAKTVYVMNDPTGLKLNGRFALDSSNKTGNQKRWMWRNNSNAYQKGLAGQWNSNGTSVTSYNISILNLKKDDQVKITFSIQSGKDAAPKTCSANIISTTIGGTGIVAETSLTSNTTYYMLADGNLDLYVLDNNLAIEKIVIVTEGDQEIIDANPTISVSAGDASTRTVSIASPKTNLDNNTVTYYTKDGSTPTSASTRYNGDITITAADLNANRQVTIKAISYKDGDTNIESGVSTYTLGVPVYYRSVKFIDFTSLTEGQGANGNVSAKFGSNTLQQYLGDNVNVLDEDFYVQMQDGSNHFYNHNGGLYSYYGGGRRVGLTNLKAGQLVKINADSDNPGQEVNSTAASVFNYGRNFYFTVNADGNTSFAIPRYTVIKSIEVLESTTIGAIDCSSGYLAAKSSPITLSNGESLKYTFVNHNSGNGGNWNNWILNVQNNSSEAVVNLRADFWDDIAGGNTGCEANIAWNSFVADMNGATVDMTITYSDGTLHVNNTIATLSSKNWYYNYTKSGLEGDLTFALSENLAWLEILSTEKIPANVSCAVSAHNYATFSAPYALDLSNMTEGYKAYQATAINGETVTLESVEGTVAANTGLIIKGTGTAGTCTIPVVANGTDISSTNMLVAVTADNTTITAGNYVLGVDQEVVKFLLIESTEAQLNAGKSYLAPATPAGAKLRFVFNDGEVNAITEVNASKTINAAYNLNGQRVKADAKGIVIVNGKKFYNK